MLKWNILIYFVYLILLTNILISSKNLQYSKDEQYFLNDDIECPENCQDGKCDNITKKCDSCKEGYYQDDCTANCPTINCLQCEQDSGECLECKDDLIVIDEYCCDNFCKKCDNDGCTMCVDDTKYGKKCENCPEYCEQIKGERKCNQTTGNCFSCIIGKFGEKCDNNCSKGCNLVLNNCDMKNGSCTCKDKYYGSKCDNNCDENCINCDKINGTCYQCENGYYPKGIECIKCPDNCEGECPDGICLKCKDGYYGDICTEDCPVNCINKTCDKNDGKCDCINKYSRDSNCTECINHFDLNKDCTQCVNHYNITTDCDSCINNYDIKTNCTSCINSYDINSECKECLPNYNISTECIYCLYNYDIKSNCTSCINSYDISTDCTQCLSNYDISTDCTQCLPNYDINTDCTSCINDYDIKTGCKECLPNFDIKSNCTSCINSYDINTNCTKCLSNYDIKTDCIECLNFYDIESQCTECLSNYDIKSNCMSCINSYDINTNCTQCLPNYDINTDCTLCLNSYDINTNCTQCLSNYDIKTDCIECLNFYDIESQCTECLYHFDPYSNCTKCLYYFDEKSNCTSCLYNYDVNKECKECLFNYDIQSNCTICLDNYNISTDCTNCLDNYDLSTNCTLCLNYYDIDSNCTKCLYNYNIDTDCIYCLNNYDIESNCTLCLNSYDITTECIECLTNYDIKTNCTSCINSYDINSECKECLPNYNISTECIYCLYNYDIKSNCTSCLNSYDISTDCTQCLSNYDINTDCIECLTNFDIKSNCTSCLNSYDIKSNCTSCINSYDINTNCTQCLYNYDIKSNCTSCINSYDINTDCTQCLSNYDIKSNCTSCINSYDINTNCNQCLPNYDINTDCTLCLNSYNINTNCTQCLSNYDIKSNCTKCLENYDITNFCESCEGNYNLTENCEVCINHFDLSTKCEKCQIHFTLSSNCIECEQNYNITTDCTTCINQFDLSTNCEKCHLGYYGFLCNESCYEGCDLSVLNCRQEDGYCEKCIFPYYGEKCEYKAEIDHCISINKTTGNCMKCEETYYLSNNLCKKCSSNCNNSRCYDGTGRCLSCGSFKAYGDFCEKNCSEFCNKNDTELVCERDSGVCNFGCYSLGNFSDGQCTKCKDGFYPQSEGCTTPCPKNCLNPTCNKYDGSCVYCKNGFYGDKCTNKCGPLCATSCEQYNGRCKDCIEGYYYKDSNCLECPGNCTRCDAEKCSICKPGFFGNKCEEICSMNCKYRQCEINGNCPCDDMHYGEKCSLNCNGCTEDNGCEDSTGKCKDPFCKNGFYDPRMCDRKCSNNCEGERKCDLFTGECNSCKGHMWGMNCEKICHKDCENDGRVDCCYIKDEQNPGARGINIDIEYKNKKNNYNDLREDQNDFALFKINLGGYNLTILADFESNSPLVIFDLNTEIIKTETEIYNISIELIYNSSGSIYYKEIEKNYQATYDYDGFSLNKEKVSTDRLILNKEVFDDFPFLICKEFKLEKDFYKVGDINGIVGLGLRSNFTENLFWYNLTNKFPKNILMKSISISDGRIKSIYIGDYNDEVRNGFAKLSTMEIDNKKSIVMNKVISYETSFTGIAYSLRKAYEYKFDKKVKLDNKIETTIVFNNLYKQFFEKIYFGDLFENGCYFRILQGGQGEYYCDVGKQQALMNLPRLGLILGDYIYYLSYKFLYKESGQFITFLIKLNGQSQERIDLGKSFFNEFSVIYNNGNETLNFFGDIKKLSITLRDPSNILNIDSDVFTPGGWVAIIAFSTALIIVFCYLIKYCGQKNVSDEDDMDDEDDDLFIGDTIEDDDDDDEDDEDKNDENDEDEEDEDDDEEEEDDDDDEEGD